MNIKEIKRYLGVRSDYSDIVLDEKINLIYGEIKKSIKPKSVSAEFTKSELSKFLVFGDKLTKHLNKCDKCLVFCATLGINADLIVGKYSVSNISDAAIAQSIEATILEEYADECQKNLCKFSVPRYSPGYGDFPISEQKKVLDLLNATKRIGVSVTDSFMLMPTKSITAVIGISDKDTLCNTQKCLSCDNIDCEFRQC